MCDHLLVDTLYPIIKRLLKSDVIKQWFFIRYGDPEFHLRIRVELEHEDNLSIVLAALNKRLIPLYNHHLLHKIVIDTYEREIERYGIQTMELTEQLFCIDSHCVCSILKCLMKHEKENGRWKEAIIWIDTTLDAYGLNLHEKSEIMEIMSKGYLKEFGYDVHNIKPLASRYRQLESSIGKLLEDGATREITDVMNRHAKMIKNRINHIDVSRLNVRSLLHMSMNRLFASRNRANELVLYYCLDKYYRSRIKRMQKTEERLE